MVSRRRFLAAAPLLALAGCSGRSNPEPLLVGHIDPFTGGQRSAGESVKRGMLLALEEVNGESEQVAGRRLAMVHADSRGQPERARSEAVRLATLNRLVAAVGGRDQASADRLAQALQTYPIPLLTAVPCATPSLDSVFTLGVSLTFRGESLANFAADHLKARRAALVTDDSLPACAAVAAAFSRRWRSKSDRSLETFDASTDDSAVRLGKSEAQVIVIAASADTVKAVRTAKVAKPIVFAGEPAEWQRLETDVDAGPETFGAVVHAPSAFDEDGKAFLKRYRDRHGEDADADACRGWEMVRVLAYGLRESKGTGGTRLRDELVKTEKLPGLTGPFGFKDGLAQRPLFVVRARAPEVLRRFATTSD